MWQAFRLLALQTGCAQTCKIEDHPPITSNKSSISESDWVAVWFLTWIKWPNMVKHCLRDEARTKSCEWSFTNMQCFICSFKAIVSNLTWAHQSFGTEAAEVVAFTVRPPNLPKFTRATGTLAAHTVSASATGQGFWVGAAAALLAGFIFSLGALASRAQSARIAQAHAALQGSIAVVTGRAGGHGGLLTAAFTNKVHSDLKAVFKAHWLHDEVPTLFFGTAVKFRLNVKWNLWESRIRNCRAWH